MYCVCSWCKTQFDVGNAKPGSHVRCLCGGVAEVPATVKSAAHALHCSSCGAGVEPGALQCHYCENEISPASRRLGDPCPECFVPLLKDRPFCPGCGLEIKPIALDSELSNLDCPRCPDKLHFRPDGKGAGFHECQRCDGFWIDGQVFKSLIHQKDEAHEAIPGFAAPKRPEQQVVHNRPHVDTNAYAPCPECKTLMNRKNFARCSGVIIDWCAKHGYWFDGGELDRIVAWVAEGGLDSARKVHERRQKEKERVDRFRRNFGEEPVESIPDYNPFLEHKPQSRPHYASNPNPAPAYTGPAQPMGTSAEPAAPSSSSPYYGRPRVSVSMTSSSRSDSVLGVVSSVLDVLFG